MESCPRFRGSAGVSETGRKRRPGSSGKTPENPCATAVGRKGVVAPRRRRWSCHQEPVGGPPGQGAAAPPDTLSPHESSAIGIVKTAEPSLATVPVYSLP